ncbi:MAG: glycosyltransferase [Deltaproteobacteria bacterium]
MHIVVYYPKRLPVNEYGGVERAVVWLIKGLSELGHEVTFIGPEGSNVPHCRNLSGNFADVKVPLPSAIRGLIPADADIIHFHNDSLFEHDYGIPSIVTVYGALKDFKGLTAKYCFISDAQRRYWGYKGNPVVHIGLDRDEYIYREDKDDYFLFLSRVDWDVKGVGWAIDAAEKAGVRLIIAGNVHRKKFVNSYFRGFLKRRLNDRITYVGPVGGELKAMLLAKARALVFPTQWCEAFGIVTIEALASGTPVITTYNGAMPEIVDHGITGFLCKNAGEMADALRKVDTLKPADCLTKVIERFNCRRMAEDYAALYMAIIKGMS